MKRIEFTKKKKLMTPCLSFPGGIVALGKFDALHIGHRELAIQAAKVGPPFLLSFVGMAEILGWELRYGYYASLLSVLFQTLSPYDLWSGSPSPLPLDLLRVLLLWYGKVGFVP